MRGGVFFQPVVGSSPGRTEERHRRGAGGPEDGPQPRPPGRWGSVSGPSRSSLVWLCPWIGPSTHTWGRDVWPQPTFAASPPFSTFSKICASGNDPASFKQPDKLAAPALSLLLLLPAH